MTSDANDDTATDWRTRPRRFVDNVAVMKPGRRLWLAGFALACLATGAAPATAQNAEPGLDAAIEAYFGALPSLFEARYDDVPTFLSTPVYTCYTAAFATLPTYVQQDFVTASSHDAFRALIANLGGQRPDLMRMLELPATDCQSTQVLGEMIWYWLVRQQTGAADLELMSIGKCLVAATQNMSTLGRFKLLDTTIAMDDDFAAATAAFIAEDPFVAGDLGERLEVCGMAVAAV